MNCTVVVALFVLGCGTLAGARASEAVDPQLTYDEFRALPYQERERTIATLEPSRQIDAYLAMLDESEPPDLGLAWRVAPTGAPLVDAAQARLEHDSDENHQSDLLFLLWAIHQKGHADVRGRAQLMALLEVVVQKTTNDALRKANAETLARIRSSPPGGQEH